MSRSFLESPKTSFIALDTSENKNDVSWNFLLSNLVFNALPTMIYLISIYAVFAISLHFVGQLNNPYLLDAVGISLTILNSSAVGLVICLNTGLTAVASQAFGAKNDNLVGIYLHRGLIINIVVCSLCCIFLAFSFYIFQAMNLPQQTQDYAYSMILKILGAMYCFSIFDTLKSYLMAQEIYLPQVIIQVFIAGLHWLWCYIFISYLEMEEVGVAIATTITLFSGVALLFGYILICNPTPKSWFWFKKDSFHGFVNLLKVQIPIASTIYLEWMAFEVLVLFSSVYPVNEIGAQITFYNLLITLYNIPLGLATALNALVGNAIGKGDVIKIRRLLYLGICCNIVIGICIAGMLYFLNEYIILFFTSLQDVIDIVKEVCIIYLYILPFDFSQCLLGAYVRGIGKERIASIMFVICYYGVGIPTAFILGNVLGYEVHGLWYGLGCGIFCMFLSSSIIILRTDLEEQTSKIKERLLKDHQCLNETTITTKSPDN